jgi:accessory gene regulator B
MIKLLAEKITAFFITNKIIKEDEIDIYSYGFEYIIASLTGIAGITSIALLFGLLPNTIGFIAAFTLIRMTSGGYHAETYYWCLIIFILVYIANIFILTLIIKLAVDVVPISMVLISTPIIFIFGPVDHKNKPFTTDEFLYYRSRGRLAILLLSLVVLGGFNIFKGYKDIFSAISLGVITASLSVMLAKIKEKSNYDRDKGVKINYQ